MIAGRETAVVVVPPGTSDLRAPFDAAKTRLLIEVWWETRERPWARRVLRGWVKELPDGVPRGFRSSRQLAALVVVASRRRRSGG